jgi:hypothetical protein
MNERTTYELTINEKLQHLPLPNLEEAIWARVKTQLDIDMPSDDGGGSDPGSPSGSGWTWGAGGFIFIAALVAVFLVFKKSKQQPFPTIANPVQTTTTSLTPAPQKRIDSHRAVGNKAPGPAPTLNGETPPGLLAAPPTDSVSVVTDNRLPVPDTLQQTTLQLPPPAVVDTARQKPKTRGVPGITDNDYRIVPAKKDSL